MKYFSEEQRRSGVEGLLGSVSAVKVAAVAKPQVPSLSENSVKVLVKAGLEPGLFMRAVGDGLGLFPAEVTAASRDLEARGLVKVHSIVLKGRSGQAHVLEVLPLGKEELSKRGITAAEKLVKRGGFRHDLYARYQGQWAKARGFRHWFERQMGVKSFDFVYEDAEGNLFGIENCLTGIARWNAEQALKAASVAGIAQVIVACEKKGTLEGIFKEVKQLDQLGLFQSKIVGKLCSEFLE